MNIYDVIIVGAGSSGLFCGSTFSKKIHGLILEKNKLPGRKFLMSGSGKCNITHGGSIKDFVKCYGENGAKIRGCLYKYSNISLLSFLNSHGIETFTREDGKVFPSSLNGSEILSMMIAECKNNGFNIKTSTPLTSVSRKANFYEIKSNDKVFYGRNIVFATGGSSYPSTGSDGSILKILNEQLGFVLVPTRPALTPINVQEYPYSSLSGISIESVSVSIFRNNKKIASKTGTVLFTHKNFSGPCILDISRYILPGDEISLNYLFPMDFKTITDVNYRELPLPKRFLKLIQEEEDNKRKVIAKRLCDDRFTVLPSNAYATAMATCGGISLDNVNLSSMESKKFPGIYIIGETLDIDGDTGGYNLQFAFSSAKAANKKIENDVNTL